MQLRITIVGPEPKPVRPVSELLGLIDFNLAVLEGETIRRFATTYPDYDRRSVESALTNFRRSYDKGDFSMLLIESAKDGSLILKFVVEAVAMGILEATILGDMKEEWKTTKSSKQIRKVLRSRIVPFFAKSLSKNLPLALENGVAEFNRTSFSSTTAAIEESKVTKLESCDILDVKLKLQYDGTMKSYYEMVSEFNSELAGEQGMSLQEDEDNDNHLTTGLG